MPGPFGRTVRLAVALAVLAGLVLLGAAPPASAANGEPFQASQWGIRQIGADVAWTVNRGGGARIGIIDTGIDFAHVELGKRVLASTRCMNTGGNVSRCSGSAQDDSGHGTHVAGIVGAPLDGRGVAGVAPDASLLIVKALRADGGGEASDVAAGIEWLLAQGANVINLSLAETLSPRRVQGSPLEAAIRRAASAGAVVVLAAGNHGEPVEGATAFNLPAIVVAATAKNGRLARYSQPLSLGVRWGISAPGGDGAAGTEGEIVSTYWFAGRRDSYAWSEGTSMAAPHVAGAAGLLAAQGVRGNAAVERLLGSALTIDCGAGCSGLLNARAAVGAAVPAPTQAASGPGRAVAAPVATTPTTSSTPASPPPSVVDAAPPITGLALPPEKEPVAPIDRSVDLQTPPGTHGSNLLPVLAAVAGLALLAVTAAAIELARATKAVGRRIRADEGW